MMMVDVDARLSDSLTASLPLSFPKKAKQDLWACCLLVKDLFPGLIKQSRYKHAAPQMPSTEQQ
jgi:hypothetical protein